MPQLLYPLRKRPWYPLIRRMDVLKQHSGCFGKEKPLLQLPQIKSQFFDSPPHSLVIIPIYNILARSHFRDVNITSVGAISWDVTGSLSSEHKLLQKCHSVSTSTTDKSSETFKYPQTLQGERTTVVTQPPHVQNTNIYCWLSTPLDRRCQKSFWVCCETQLCSDIRFILIAWICSIWRINETSKMSLIWLLTHCITVRNNFPYFLPNIHNAEKYYK